jgi:hypothetical protein
MRGRASAVTRIPPLQWHRLHGWDICSRAHGRGLDGVVCDMIGEGGLRGVGGTSSGKQERTVRRLHSHLGEENHALNVVVL